MHMTRSIYTKDSLWLNIGRHKVFVRTWGDGSIPVVALHGFSDTGAIFEPFGKVLADHCTLYAVDLPFHGKTQWKSKVISRRHIREIVCSIRRCHPNDAKVI